jgi:hypothetical protein
MWTSRVLSIIVKNMQSYIVAIVWGTAEVLAIFTMVSGKWSRTTSNKAPGNSKESYRNRSVAPSSVAVASVISPGVTFSGGDYK